MSQKEVQKNFIENELSKLIMNSNEDLQNETLVRCEASASDQLDGFMSIIFKVDLIMENIETGNKSKRELIVKLMKGTEEFRNHSNSFVQFKNEVYIYGTVIPYFQKYLKSSKTEIDSQKWVPRVYYQHFGKMPSLSDMDEAILALENIQPEGFRLGPRLELDLDHLLLMLKVIAEYHSLTYALRIQKNPMLQTLIDDLIPLPWKEENGGVNWYHVVYPIAFDRLFDFCDRNPQHLNVGNLKEELDLLKKRYGKDPISLLERMREDDRSFSVILHGDYNRNNVLFKYKESEGFENPLELRMIDFQEVRYGSPAIDLFFFLYMSTNPVTREHSWQDILHCYHDNVIKCLREILHCQEDDERLADYSYEKFQEHFSRYAIYGVLVTVHFLPWMDCSEEECNLLSSLFEQNMHSKEFWDISMTVGGDISNEKIISVVQHASKMGYLKMLYS